MSARRYEGSALGGTLRAELTAEAVDAWWQDTDEDLRDRDPDGTITLWVRSVDGTFRHAPVRLTPIRETVS
jgi:hypothetical protein